MYTKRATIVNAAGFHARPASDFVSIANKYPCDIKIRNSSIVDSQSQDAKSIIGLLLLGLSKGSEAEVTASGEDEEEAVEELTAFIESGFGEI